MSKTNKELNRIMSENIKYYLSRKGITEIKDFANQLGFKYTTVLDWVNAKTYPRIDKIEKMAKYFGVDKADLVEKHVHDNIQGINKQNIKYIPLIGTIAMGTPITADENIERYIPEFFLDDIPTSELFALHCKGHSMEPTIPDGAIAIIHQQPTVEDDEIAAVLIGEEATLKRVKHMGNSILLMPDNKDYDPIIVDKEHPAEILGKMIKYEVSM